MIIKNGLLQIVWVISKDTIKKLKNHSLKMEENIDW